MPVITTVAHPAFPGERDRVPGCRAVGEALKSRIFTGAVTETTVCAEACPVAFRAVST